MAFLQMKRLGLTGMACFLMLIGNPGLRGQEASENTDYQYALIEAVKQKNLGNLPDAVKLYKLVIQSKPDCDVAYYELGTIYMVTDQMELAQEYLQ